MSTAPDTGQRVVLSDEDLMRRIQSDDMRAFEAFYDRYSARAFGLARVICHGSRRAEEAVQEGFLCVWRSRGTYDPTRGSARAWLLTVIRHRSIDVMRRDRQVDDRWAYDDELDYLADPSSIAEDVEQQDEAGRLRASLRELPAAQREVVALAYFSGLTHTEIAARLQIPAGTVKGRMRLGLGKVRAELDAPQPPRSAPAEPLAPQRRTVAHFSRSRSVPASRTVR